jgi:integrase
MAAIVKRGDNSYRLTVSCGYDKEGKQIRKTKTIDLSHISSKKQLAEAEKQFILFQEEIEGGLYIDAGKVTFETFINKWLKDYAEPTLAPKTVHRYKELLNTRIIPALGHIKLNKIQPTHLTEFYNNLRENGIRLDKKYTPKEDFFDSISKLGITSDDIIIKANVTKRTINNIKLHRNINGDIASKISKSIGIKVDSLFNEDSKTGGLSEKTILHHHRLISSMLTSAVQWQFIVNNPASRVKPPKVEKKEARHFEEEQVEYILSLLQGVPIKYRAMINLSLYGGMRMGELAGLDWSDIDLENKILKIRQSSQYLPGEGVFTKDTKNFSSHRVISLPNTVITIINEYKLWQNGEKAKLENLWDEKSTRIFTTRTGTPMFPATPSKWFSKFIKNHNERIMNDNSIKKEDKEKYLIDEVNFHGLRHTSASLLIAEGVDVVTVSKRLGHSKTSTTTDIYAHSLKKTDVEASNKLENLFNKKEKNEKQG